MSVTYDLLNTYLSDIYLQYPMPLICSKFAELITKSSVVNAARIQHHHSVVECQIYYQSPWQFLARFLLDFTRLLYG
jgi:hypothetical protein